MTTGEPDVEEGWVAAALVDELPDLRLRSIVVAGTPGKSSKAVRERLAVLSNRFHGAQAIELRRAPVPHAYRVFFRTIGLDPDDERPPLEAAALDRLIEGGFKPKGRIPDALLLGLVETGVPLWAIDDATLDGPLGIRMAATGERLGRGEYANDIAPGRIVVADAEEPVAILFGEIAEHFLPKMVTQRLRVFTVQVDGVPELHVEEALWSCAEALMAG